MKILKKTFLALAFFAFLNSSNPVVAQSTDNTTTTTPRTDDDDNDDDTGKWGLAGLLGLLGLLGLRKKDDDRNRTDVHRTNVNR